jgi:hypothetical protein
VRVRPSDRTPPNRDLNELVTWRTACAHWHISERLTSLAGHYKEYNECQESALSLFDHDGLSLLTFALVTEASEGSVSAKPSNAECFCQVISSIKLLYVDINCSIETSARFRLV